MNLTLEEKVRKHAPRLTLEEKAQRREELLKKKREYSRKWYQENKEKVIAQQAEYWQHAPLEVKERRRARSVKWFQENPERRREYGLLHRYGITLSTWRILWEKQGKCCAICKCAGDLDSLLIDHAHDSNKVRGLLCRRCNTGIGQFNDNPTLVAAAATYLTTADLNVIVSPTIKRRNRNAPRRRKTV